MVQKVSTWMPLAGESADDARLVYGTLIRPLEFANWLPTHPQTLEEQESGWVQFTDSTGYTGPMAIGWRAEEQRAEADARREAEMAACPYIACTCGWHEDPQ